MLIDLIRKVIPIRKRQDIGLWTAKKASKFKFLAYPYFFLLCGKIPKNLRLLSHNECATTYLGEEIASPRDGILSSMEVIQDEVYEKLWSPKETDIVIDAGAYVGAFTVKAAKLVGEKGIVIAIEPEPKNISYLKRNTEPFRNIKIIDSAISNYNGVGTLYISNASPCHTLTHKHKDSVEIKVNTLDSIATQLKLPHIDFIKMDIEGANLIALEGATETLKRPEVKLAIAAYHNLLNGKPELPCIATFLEDRGFSIHSEGGYIYAKKNTKTV